MDEPILIVSAFPERREALEVSLEEHGHFISECIEAPKGAEVLSTHPEYRACHRWLDPIEKRPLTYGELACYAGHRDAWTRIVELDTPCIVLEDDARLKAPLDSKGFMGDVCYLGGKEMAEPQAILEGWRSADYVYHCSAIRYTPKAAMALIRATEGRPVIPVDEILPWHCAFHGNPNIDGLKHGVANMLKLDAWAVDEWIVEQSGDFRGTETNDCAVELHTLIPASEPWKAKEAIERYKRFRYFPQVIGEGEPSWDRKKAGGAPKLKWIKAALEGIPKDSIVLVADGYDTLPAVGPDQIVTRFLEMDADIVIGGESNHWPENEELRIKLEYRHGNGPLPEAPRKYPNSGVIVADSGSLKALLAPVDDFGEDDQAWWQEAATGLHPSRLRVDSESYISLQANGVRVERRNGHPYDPGTGCFTGIVHGNGGVEMDAIKPLHSIYGTPADMPAEGIGNWIEVADGIIAMPFLDPGFCMALALNGDDVPNLWKALKGDPVPGDELRIREMDAAAHEQIDLLLSKHVAPVLEARWRPAAWKPLKDLFMIRYSKDGQNDIGLHNDQSYFSCSVILRKACGGGELHFPRQNFKDTDIGVGWLLAWPAPITHPHMVQPVSMGKRVSLVVWTGE